MVGEISNLFDMKVFTEDGVYLGKVAEVVIDTDSKVIKGLALVEYNRALINSRARGVIVPYRIVKAVGDIVVVKNVFRKRKEEEKEERVEGEQKEGQ